MAEGQGEQAQDTLALVASRAQDLLRADAAALAYLAEQGLPATAVFFNYQVGATGKELLTDLNENTAADLSALGLLPRKGLSPLCMRGILIPTYDPRKADKPIGLVKLTPAQNKHGFITPPAGIACPPDIAAHERIVLVDSPLLMLRLATHKTQGVVLAETLEVLEPLKDWLNTRKVVFCSYKTNAMTTYGATLTALGIEHEAVFATATFHQLPEKTLKALRIKRPPAPDCPKPTTALPPVLIRKILDFAQEQLSAGRGQDVLTSLGLFDATLVNALGIGYLPNEFMKSLSPADVLLLKGRVLTDALVLPATDEQGVAVDLLTVKPRGKNVLQVNAHAEPKGLLCSRVASSNEQIIVVPTLTILAKLWSMGLRNVLLMRGAEDAHQNAQRLAAAGVHDALVLDWSLKSAEAIAEVLHQAGIEATPSGLPKKLDQLDAAWIEKAWSREERAARPVQVPVANEPVSATSPPKTPGGTADPCIDHPTLAVRNGDARPAAEGPHGPGEAAAQVPALGVESSSTAFAFSSSKGLETKVPAPDPTSELGDEGDAFGNDPLSYPSTPSLTGHDERLLRATFIAKDASYEVETALDVGRQLKVVLTKDGLHHGDRLDLAKAAQRKRFAESSALKLKVPFEAVEAHLEHIEREVQRLQDAMLNPGALSTVQVVAVSDQDRQQATAYLRSPDLMDAVAADLEAMGLVGERRNALLLYLAATSRKLPFTPPQTPVSTAIVSASGSGKTHTIESVCALMPPEDVVHISKLTDAALFHFDRGALLHKVLVVPEADAITPEVSVALRVLLSSGALTHSAVNRDAATGRARTETVEMKAAVTLLTSTTGGLDDQVQSRCIEARVDESVEQTQRIVAAQLRMRAARGTLDAEGQRGQIIARHHALQRMLTSKPVVIPFAEDIVFPAFRVQHRRMVEKFLNLIAASALLHQYQRLTDEGCVLATEADFAVAAHLLAPQIERAGNDLSVHAQDVLDLIRELKASSFSTNDLRVLRPEWDRYRFRAGLDELQRMEVLVSPGRSRPKKYTLVDDGLSRINLAKVTLRQISANTFANSTDVRATG